MRVRRRFATGSGEGWRFPSIKLPHWFPAPGSIPIPRKAAVLTALIAFTGALLLGYLIAALFLFPAPIFAGSGTVPRVVGMQGEAARTALEQAGFAVREGERTAHPTAASGTVVWQDPPAEVVAPEGTEVMVVLSAGPARVPIPDVAGYEIKHARALLEATGLQLRIESAQAPVPRDVVVNTRPTAGTALLPGSAVTVVVSVGAPTIRVPNLAGLTLDEARIRLEQSGLVLGPYYRRTRSDVEPGRVVEQIPASGTLSAPGTPVVLHLARGGTP